MSDRPAIGSGGAQPALSLFGLAGGVYAQRHGKILILKRARGELTGAWAIPSGVVEAGETPEEAARRELQEEAGLVPSGPLTLIGLVPMRIYGTDTVQATYACDCPDGEVATSEEHSGARWVDPREYRERYFSDDVIARVGAGDQRIAGIIRAVRDDLDRYLAWREHQVMPSSRADDPPRDRRGSGAF